MYSTAPSATVPTYLPTAVLQARGPVHCIARLRPCALRVRLHIARARALRCQHLCAGAYADTVRARACACTALVLRTVLLVRRLGLVSVGSVCHIGASLLSVGSSFVRLCGCLFVCARRPPTRESGRTRLHHSLRRSQASTASLRREAKARKPTLEPFGAPQAYPSVPFSRCTLDALATEHTRNSGHSCTRRTLWCKA
jgi:hypothetical protein